MGFEVWNPTMKIKNTKIAFTVTLAIVLVQSVIQNNGLYNFLDCQSTNIWCSTVVRYMQCCLLISTICKITMVIG